MLSWPNKRTAVARAQLYIILPVVVLQLYCTAVVGSSRMTGDTGYTIVGYSITWETLWIPSIFCW